MSVPLGFGGAILCQQSAFLHLQDFGIGLFLLGGSLAFCIESLQRSDIKRCREIDRRGYQIGLLVLALLLAAAIIAIVTIYLRKARRRSAELQHLSDAKEQIIEVLSKDLKNPANTMAGKIAGLSSSAATLPPEEIRKKCQELARNAQEINEDVAQYVGDLLVERSRKIADIGLSPREIQIIRLSAEGLTSAQIAERTFLSVHTVNTHRQRIYSKMEVRNVTDMIHKATEMGIL